MVILYELICALLLFLRKKLCNFGFDFLFVPRVVKEVVKIFLGCSSPFDQRILSVLFLHLGIY